MAGKVTLAKSALATIPSYIMQSMRIPNTVSTKIDCICRQFIWGASNVKRKVHLINWNKICSPKEEGGLGFRKAKEVNMACMMKLAWGIVSKPNSLWVRVLRNKYRCDDNIIPEVKRRDKMSNAWRGIFQIWPHFKQNLIWRVGNGHNIKIWLDHWLPSVNTLGDMSIVNLEGDDLNQNLG